MYSFLRSGRIATQFLQLFSFTMETFNVYVYFRYLILKRPGECERGIFFPSVSTAKTLWCSFPTPAPASTHAFVTLWAPSDVHVLTQLCFHKSSPPWIVVFIYMTVQRHYSEQQSNIPACAPSWCTASTCTMFALLENMKHWTAKPSKWNVAR